MKKKKLKDYSHLTTEEKRAQLLTDWIERDGGFVHQRQDGRLGWEADTAGGSYSGFVLDVKNPQTVLRKAYGFAQGLLDVMDLPRKVRISIAGTDSYTNGSCVHVATASFDDEDLTTGDAADIFAGNAIHEGCHVKWTDFDAERRHSPSGPDVISHSLCNILEDERIERQLGETFPGFVNYIKKMKYYFFDKSCREGTLKKLAPNAEEQADNPATRIMNAVLKLVRYPDEFEDRDIEDFGNELLQVRDVLTPFPSTTAQVCETADAIKEIIMRWLTTQPQPPAQNGGGQGRQGPASSGGQKQQGSDSSDTGDDQKDNGSKKKRKKSKKDDPKDAGDDEQDVSGGHDGDGENEEERSSESPEQGEGDERQDVGGDDSDGKSHSEEGEGEKEDDGQDRNGSSAGKNNGGGLSKEDAEKLLEEICQDILGSIAKDAGAELSDDEKSDFVQKNEPVIDAIMDEKIDAGENTMEKFIVVYPEKLDDSTRDTARQTYLTDSRKVRPLVPTVRKILAQNETEYKRTARGKMSGSLDTGKLAEAYQGAKPVYTRKELIKTDKCAVCVLIDESGSMWGEKQALARLSSVLLYDGLKGLRNVELFIYGYDTGRLDVFNEPGHDGESTLGYVRGDNGTPTGPAIMEAQMRIRKQTRSRCLMLVVTDGEPDSVGQTKAAIKNAQKDGFDVVGIGIDAGSSSLANTFTDYVHLDDIRLLPKELAKRVRESVLRNKRHAVVL